MKKSSKAHNIKPKFPQIMKESMGIISSACKKAGIDRDTYYRWRKEDPEFAKACDEAYDHAADFVESKLYQLINEGNPSAIIFYSKTKMKNRGYVERIETTGKDGGAIETNVQFKPNKTDERILEEMKAELLAEAQNSIISAQSNM